MAVVRWRQEVERLARSFDVYGKRFKPESQHGTVLGYFVDGNDLLLNFAFSAAATKIFELVSEKTCWSVVAWLHFHLCLRFLMQRFTWWQELVLTSVDKAAWETITYAHRLPALNIQYPPLLLQLREESESIVISIFDSGEKKNDSHFLELFSSHPHNGHFHSVYAGYDSAEVNDEVPLV